MSRDDYQERHDATIAQHAQQTPRAFAALLARLTGQERRDEESSMDTTDRAGLDTAAIRARLDAAPAIVTVYPPPPGSRRHQLATAADNAAVSIYGRPLAELMIHAPADLAALVAEVDSLRAQLAERGDALLAGFVPDAPPAEAGDVAAFLELEEPDRDV